MPIGLAEHTSRNCSCVFPAPPSNVLTRLPNALDGPAPSDGVHISEPATRSRSDIFRYGKRASTGQCETSLSPFRYVSIGKPQRGCTQGLSLQYIS